MCDLCTKDNDAAPANTRRRKLWEIESGWHCMIVGTCISMPELRRLSAKMGVQTRRDNVSDYEIHAFMVGRVSRDRRIAKEMHKFLDRKFASWPARFSKLRDVDALMTAWTEAVERGEVAGALWGLMSHPAATAELQGRIFGEVHMLSHQVGAASRADLRRIHGLEKEKADLEDKVARQQDRLHQGMASRDDVIRDLREQLENDRAELRRLSYAAASLSELDGLKALTAELQRHVALEEAGRKTAETRVRDLESALEEARAEAGKAGREVDELRHEHASLETQFLAAGTFDRTASCDASCASLDLCGRCILYVGGRANHIPHLRQIVEKRNGTLVHHDGGFEENMSRLSALLGQADAVMFPVDCVSHMAHDQLKRLCKRWSKPFVPVRRSGLGAFLRALETVEGESGTVPAQ
jgi:energy-converting hydrogenase A subunit M